MIRRSIGPRLGAAVAALGLAGCATPLVSGDTVRDGPYRTIVARAAEVRGLPLREPVPARVVEQREVPELLRAVIEAGLTRDEIAAYQDALTAIGLWPEGRGLVEEYVAVAGEEVLGFYVARDRTLYVVRDAKVPLSVQFVSALLRRDLARELVLGHEVLHALQHQAYPDVLAHDRFLQGQDDLGSALQAALEGDATYYAFAVTDPPLPPPDPRDFRADLEHEASDRPEGALAAAPALIREGLYFPYARGYALAHAEGPLLLEEPPVSTEQVLHAGRRNAPFEAIDLAPARALLPAGCAFVHENGLGEFALSVLFRELAAPSDAVDPGVWRGWDGDRYLVARCDGRRELFWLTRWDTEADALEFEDAYAAFAEEVQARGGLAAPPALARRGTEVRMVTPGLAGASDAMAAAARRGRVSTLREVLAFWGEAPVSAQ